jgi:hypothetical protein
MNNWTNTIISDDEIITGNRLMVVCQNSKTTYCKSEHLNKIKTQKPWNLLTHNSDKYLTSSRGSDFRSFSIADAPLFKNKWFAQNNRTNHPHIISIPIGLVNFTSLDQNTIEPLKIFKSFCDQKNRPRQTRSNLVYSCFNPTDPCEQRRNLSVWAEAQSWITSSPKVPHIEFYKSLSSSKFCLSPEGNGPDCHRHWEALYLGCIPIVKKHPAMEQFKDLPFLFVGDWCDISEEWLDKKYKEFMGRHFNIEKLYLSFWAKQFNE